MDSPSRVRAQGALEYLLLIGGAVLLATLVMFILFNSAVPYASSSVQNVVNGSQQQLLNGSGLNTTPVPLANGPFSIGDNTNYLVFDFTSTPAQNLQLTQLVSPIQSFSLSVDSLWKVEFQNTTTQAKFLVDSASVAMPVSMVVGNPTQLVWDNIEVEPNSNAFAQVSLFIFRSGSNFEFKTRVILPPGYDMVSIHFPEFHFLPQGSSGADDYLITGWQGGQRIENPYVNITTPSSTSSPGPNPIGMFALYDESTRTGLYWSLQDGTGYTKSIRVAGGITDLEWEATHLVPIPTSSTYETPYPLLLTAFSGNWFDAAQKYRSWALTQPMVSRGNWSSSPLVSSQAKNARALLLLSSPQSNSDYSSYHAEIDSAVGLLGTDHLLVHWYSWHAHPFDNDWPDHAEKPTFAPAVSQAHAAHPNLGIIPYYFPGSWDVDLGSSANISFPTPPNSTSYPYTPAVAAMACAQENGLPILHGPGSLGWTHTPLDPSFSQARALESQVALDLIANNAVDGLYLDAYSGSSPGICFNNPSVSGHPKNGGAYWTQNKRLLIQELRDTARGQVGDFVITSENIDEHLIPVLDIMSMYPLYFVNNGVPGFLPVPLFSAIYHDYMPLMTIEGLDPTSATPDPFGQLAQRVINANYYHAGLMPVFSNWQLPNLFLFDSSASNYNVNLDPQKAFMKELIDSYAFTRPYVRYGQMLRPVSGTLNDTLLVTPTAFSEPSVSVWRASDGKVGVILINADLTTSSLDASMVLSDYGFTSGQGVPVTIRTTSNPVPVSNGVVSGVLDLSTYAVDSFDVMLLELG